MIVSHFLQWSINLVSYRNKFFLHILVVIKIQGDFSGKPGNVREFDSRQGFY